MTARPFADLVAIGRVVKPQGRKGEVLVEPFSDRMIAIFEDFAYSFRPPAIEISCSTVVLADSA